MNEIILELEPSNVNGGVLTIPMAFGLCSILGKPILIKDSMGEYEAKIHSKVSRIDRLTSWHKSRKTKIGENISVKFDDAEIDRGMNVLHIEFLDKKDNTECGKEYNSFSFKLEKNLEDYISENIGRLETGLQIVERQYQIEGNIIDLLCIDKYRNYVVVELKNKKGNDRVVGQISRYIGCLKKQKQISGKVRGIIVTPDVDKKLEYAVSASPDISLKYFKLHIEFTDPVE